MPVSYYFAYGPGPDAEAVSRKRMAHLLERLRAPLEPWTIRRATALWVDLDRYPEATMALVRGERAGVFRVVASTEDSVRRALAHLKRIRTTGESR